MSLRESGGLPSARGTRQSQKNPRQRVCRVSTLGKRHSANLSQQTDFAECFLSGTRQRLRRVPKKHSAKIYTRQKKAKKPKNNSKKTRIFFFGGGHHRPARARLHWSRCIFCAKSAANAAGEIQTHDFSLASLLLYHCTTLSLVSRFVIYPHILY